MCVCVCFLCCEMWFVVILLMYITCKYKIDIIVSLSYINYIYIRSTYFVAAIVDDGAVDVDPTRQFSCRCFCFTF